MLDHFYFRLLFPNIEKRVAQCRSLHMMAAILMIVYSLQFVKDFQENWMQVLAILPPALIIIFLAVFKKGMIADNNNNRIFRILEVGILFMGCMGYIKTDQIFPAILFGAFALFLLFILYLENRLFTSQYIDVTKIGVSISLPTHDRKISWNDVKNIVVRDDYFTLQTAGDAIWQYRVFNSLTPDEYEQFLIFCKKNCPGT